MNPDLQQRIRTVLARMSTLSDADSGSIIAFNPNGAHGSRIPSGVRTTTPTDQLDPGHARTLFDEWAQRFAQVTEHTDPRQVQCLVLAAEAALDTVTHRLPQRLADEHDDPSTATEERCLTWYAGLPPEQAAAIEHAAYGGSLTSLTKWMERLRVRNDRDPHTGQPRPAADGRLRKIAELHAAGLSLRRIAADLGVSKTTVQRALDQIEKTGVPVRRRIVWSAA